MRTRTHCLGNAGLFLMLAGCVALLPGMALAEAPTQQGWWSAGSAPASGLLPAGTTAPDVPEDGLLVEGTASSPTAYAALSYLIAPGAVPESLVLTVAEGTATTPDASLVLHPLESPQFEAVQGGALSEAPQYDAERSVEATVDAGGKTFTFDDLGPLELTRGVAVAVVPGAAGGRVVLSAPDEASLTTSGGSSGSGSAIPPFAPPPSGGFGSGEQTDGSSSEGFADSFSLPQASSHASSSGQLAAALPPGTKLPSVAVPPADTAAPVTETPFADNLTPVAASSDRDGVERLLAGLVIVAAATATLLWAFAGGSDPDAPELPSALPS